MIIIDKLVFFELGQVMNIGGLMNIEGLVNLIGATKGAELSYLSFSQILAATKNFSESNLVGHGGFGYVYKVIFPQDIFSVGLSIAPKSENISKCTLHLG
jgi:hypothetical protein